MTTPDGERADGSVQPSQTNPHPRLSAETAGSLTRIQDHANRMLNEERAGDHGDDWELTFNEKLPFIRVDNDCEDILTQLRGANLQFARMSKESYICLQFSNN